jgi:type VI secretion system protein ImpL
MFFKPEVLRFAQEATKDSWVLGDDARFDDARRRQIAEEIRQLYFAEYIRIWEELLRDVTPKSGPSFAAMADTLRDLARPDSPWRNYLVAAARETKLAGAAPPDAPTQGTGKLDKLTGKIRQKAEELVEGGRGLVQNEPLTPVDERFAYLHRTVLPGEGSDPPPIQSVQATLSEAQAGVRGLAEKEKRGDAITAAEILQSTDKLKSEGARFPEPVGSTLKSLAQEISSRVRGSEYGRVNGELQTKVASYCIRGVRGRYPFTRSSAQEVTQEDFGRFFGPNGATDSFFQSELKTVVDSTHGAWHAKPESPIPISQHTLSAFQNAGIIRDVFFRSGGQTPALSFELKPLTMDPRILQFILDVDGQLVTYSHGPPKLYSLKWPVPGGANRVRIQISPPAPSGQSGSSQEGAWALFRMLDRANFQATDQPDRFKVTFDVEGRTATFELRASSVYNPFRLAALEQFACPDKL